MRISYRNVSSATHGSVYAHTFTHTHTKSEVLSYLLLEGSSEGKLLLKGVRVPASTGGGAKVCVSASV